MAEHASAAGAARGVKAEQSSEECNQSHREIPVDSDGLPVDEPGGRLVQWGGLRPPQGLRSKVVGLVSRQAS